MPSEIHESTSLRALIVPSSLIVTIFSDETSMRLNVISAPSISVPFISSLLIERLYASFIVTSSDNSSVSAGVTVTAVSVTSTAAFVTLLPLISKIIASAF